MRTAAKPLISEKTRWGLAFLAPSLLGVSIFVLIPFGDAVRRSFFTTVGNQFVGFENFISVLQNDAFQLATGNTLRFVALCIPLLLVLSLILAVLMQACTVKRELFQASFLLPLAVPAASVALLWRALFAEQGLINGALAAFGNESILFLNSDATFWVLLGSYLWRNAGYNMVLWLAGLSGISPALYEAARVDGAGRMACFWRITLPCLAPTFFTVSVLSLLNSFKAFREAYLVAGNYPPDSIYLLQHLFNNWFAQLDVQRMCAAAVLMAVVVTGLMLLMKLAAGKEESDW